MSTNFLKGKLMWFFRKKELSEHGQLVKNLLEREGWFVRDRRAKEIHNNKFDLEIGILCGSVYLTSKGRSGYNFCGFSNYDHKKLAKLIKQKIKFLNERSVKQHEEWVKKDLKEKLCNIS